jgi:phosphopantetheine--protein transferase-like protein
MTRTDGPGCAPAPGRDFGEFQVSLAHAAEAGVAIAKPRTPSTPQGTTGVGIDITEIADRPDSSWHVAFSAGERALLEQAVGTDGEQRQLWLTRFWSAKEAVSKAEGTGLGGDPRRFTVVAVKADALTVEVGNRVYRVEFREVGNPERLPPRRYVVAWTWGSQTA